VIDDTAKLKDALTEDVTVKLAKEIELLVAGKDLQVAAMALGMVCENVWSQFPEQVRNKALPAWIGALMTGTEKQAAARGGAAITTPVKPKLILPN
jgi:hypothetical protein